MEAINCDYDVGFLSLVSAALLPAVGKYSSGRAGVVRIRFAIGITLYM